jgi:hypothetical protein
MDQRRQIESWLIDKAMNDPQFRAQLQSEPRATIEQGMGIKLPESLKIIVIEERAGKFYLVIPAHPGNDTGEELTESELGTVAGGFNTWSADCDSGWFMPGRTGQPIS